MRLDILYIGKSVVLLNLMLETDKSLNTIKGHTNRFKKFQERQKTLHVWKKIAFTAISLTLNNFSRVHKKKSAQFAKDPVFIDIKIVDSVNE